MKKRKLKKKFLIIVTSLFALVAIISLIMILKKPSAPKIVGSWTTDGVTIYRFNKDNTGSLIVSLSEYEFTYKIDDNKIYIDFDNERSVDSTYEYTLEKDKLTLKGERGTFVFTKTKDTK